MTVALENIKDRRKLRDLRYSRDLRTMTVAIRRLMDGFFCVSVSPFQSFSSTMCH